MPFLLFKYSAGNAYSSALFVFYIPNPPFTPSV